MEHSKKEKMTILLKQLQIPTEVVKKYFSNSKLEKLIVIKQEKTWHFHLHIDHILPLNIYQLLTSKLEESFEKIATIDLTLYTDDKDADEETIRDYWKTYLQSIPNLSPAYKELVLTQQPTFENNQLQLTARNDGEAAAIKRQLESGFQKYCQKIGAQNYILVINI